MKSNTKELIMDTAWKHFSMYGYTDTNLERICKDAGITRGPLYYYFRDKEDLYRQVVVKEAEKVGLRYDEILAVDCPLMETMEKIMYLCTIYNPLLQRANADTPDIPKIEETDQLNNSVLKQIYERFEKAEKAGELKENIKLTEMIYFLYTFALGVVTFDITLNSADSHAYDKELAITIFLENFRRQYMK